MPAKLNIDAAAESSRRTLPANSKNLGMIYRPALFAQAQVRYFKQSYGLDTELNVAALVEDIPERDINFEEHEILPMDERDFDRHPAPNSIFEGLGGLLANSSSAKSIEKEFSEWIYRESGADVWHNKTLKIYGGPDLSEEEFTKLCEKQSDKKRDAEVDKAKDAHDKKLKAIKKKLSKEIRELEEDKTEAGQRKMEEIGTHLENVIGLFSGRSRRLSTSLTKRRMTSKAQADVEESEQAITEFESEIQDMGEDIQSDLEEIDEKWDEAVSDINTVSVKPAKKDIYVSQFAVAWLPFHRVDVGGRETFLAAYERQEK
jgi:hypothetical protein